MTDPSPDRSDPPAWWRDLLRDLPDAARELRVGVYGSGGAPYHHAALLARWGIEPQPVRAQEIRAGALDDLDALIFPGGGATAMGGMLAPLGVDGAAAVRRWVAEGGMYLGSCAGSFLPAAVGEGYWEAHPEARELHMIHAPLANGSDSAFEGLTSPGVGALEVEVADPDHWLVEGLPERFEIVHYNGPLFALPGAGGPSGRGDETLAAADGALRPTGATERFTPSEGFMADAPETTLLGRCVALGAFNGVAARYGAGRVVLFGSHPEFGFDALQLGWGPAARLIANALARHAEDRAEDRGRDQGGEASIPPRADDDRGANDAALRRSAGATAERLERIAARFDDLAGADPGGWLAPGHAASFLGRTPHALWREATTAAAGVAETTAAALRRLVDADAPLAPAARWLDDPPEADQDFGFVGLAQLAERTEAALETARRRLDDAPEPLAHAYDRFDDHPYQLAAGSYLSAAGLTAGAALAAATALARCGVRDPSLEARLLRDPRAERAPDPAPDAPDPAARSARGAP